MHKSCRLCFLIPAFLLAACGFTPIYGSHDNGGSSEVAADMNDVAIAPIPDRNGQILRNYLIDRMYTHGRPARPQYRLEIMLTPLETEVGIQENATSTRARLDMVAKYKLFDANDKELFSGQAHSLASFNKLDQQYGTLSSRENAYQRTLTEVGEQIVNRVSVYFAEPKPVKKPETKPAEKSGQ